MTWITQPIAKYYVIFLFILKYFLFMVQSCVFSTLLYPQQCLHPPCCCINHCLSLHLLQPIDISQNSTGITSGCKSKNHAKWQRLWQYSYVIGVGGTNPQHISHISSFLSLNNSLISWFQFPFLQRLHWWEYSQNLLSYLLLQIASQCSFVIGFAYIREGRSTENMLIDILLCNLGIKLPSYLKQMICFLPSSSLTAGLPSAIRTLKVWTMSNRKRLYMVVRIQYILDVVIVQNSWTSWCCNWCEERKFYVVRNYLILIAWKSIFHAKWNIRILKPYL